MVDTFDGTEAAWDLPHFCLSTNQQLGTQTPPRQLFSHGFHAAGDGADIARAAGLDQNKSQPSEKRRVDFGQVHLK
jgi:hypothetical protein